MPRPLADLEATAPMAVIVEVMGASPPRGSPMADAGRARGRLNSFEGTTTLIFFFEYKTTEHPVKYSFFQDIHCCLDSCQHRCHQGISRRLGYLQRRNRTHGTRFVGSDFEESSRCCCHKRWPSKFLIWWTTK